MSDYIDWLGQSGRLYRYWPVNMSLPFDPIGGNYAFCKPSGSGIYIPLYFGESGNLQERMPAHEVWPKAIRLGATLAVAHATPAGEQARLVEERDLIAFWNPLLNSQHRTAG